MTTIKIDEMRCDPLGCLRRVEEGETLVVVRDDQPVAEIRPIAAAASQLRPFGLCAGEFTVPEDFDHPLPDEVLEDFGVHEA